MTERSFEEFKDLCLRYLELERLTLKSDEDPLPTLLLDTEKGRIAGGLEMRELATAHNVNADLCFYVVVPAAILSSRAYRWAVIWAQWESQIVHPSEEKVLERDERLPTEKELSDGFARSKYLETEQVIKPPSEQPDRKEVQALIMGTPESETAYRWEILRSDGPPEYYDRREMTAMAGRVCEPAREAVRLVANSEEPQDEKEMKEIVKEFTDRLMENVTDSRRVLRK